jgi:hypothetical protein
LIDLKGPPGENQRVFFVWFICIARQITANKKSDRVAYRFFVLFIIHHG